MKWILTLVALMLAFVAVQASPDETQDLRRLIVPNDQAEALKAIETWVESRGLDCEIRNGTLIFTKGGLLFSIHPLVSEKQLDRLVVNLVYRPKDEFKGSMDLVMLATKLNRDQNFLKVFVAKDDNFEVQGNLTFYDELTAHEFDSFLELYSGIFRQYILTQEALKFLK